MNHAERRGGQRRELRLGNERDTERNCERKRDRKKKSERAEERERANLHRL